MTSRWGEREREILGAPPSHDELVLRLRALVKETLAAGAPRDEILAALEELRREDPDRADVALDVMDFVVGWSSPHASFIEPTGSS